MENTVIINALSKFRGLMGGELRIPHDDILSQCELDHLFVTGLAEKEQRNGWIIYQLTEKGANCLPDMFGVPTEL